MRKRLRDLGLDTPSPVSSRQTSPYSSRDRTVTLNSHQYLRSTDALSFEASISDTDMSPYDASLKSVLRPDDQIPVAQISFPTYATSISSSASAGPLSSSTSPSQRTYNDRTDPTSSPSLCNSASLAVRLDESNMPCDEGDNPIPQETNLPRVPNLESMFDISTHEAYTLTSSTVGEQTGSQALPLSQASPRCSTPFPSQVHPRWTTPLHMAVSQGNFSVMRLLLSYGADPNAVNSEGATALHVGVMNGNYTMVAELLQRGADPTLTNAAGWLPLHHAVHTDNESCVQALLEAEQPVHCPKPELDYS